MAGQNQQQHQLPLHIGFNQDNGCFAVGEANGFRIFNTCPFNEQVRKYHVLT